LRKLLIACLVFVAFKAVTGVYHARHGAASKDLATSVAEYNQKLPMQITTNLTADSVEYEGGVLRFNITQHGGPDASERTKAAFVKAVKEEYCHGNLKRFADQGVTVEYSVRTPSHSLSDLQGPTWVVTFHSGECPF
jgi:hypothetical protein